MAAKPDCPMCGSSDVKQYNRLASLGFVIKFWRCKACRHEWQTRA